jgi:hypothetical protein
MYPYRQSVMISLLKFVACQIMSADIELRYM